MKDFGPVYVSVLITLLGILFIPTGFCLLVYCAFAWENPIQVMVEFGATLEFLRQVCVVCAVAALVITIFLGD